MHETEENVRNCKLTLYKRIHAVRRKARAVTPRSPGSLTLPNRRSEGQRQELQRIENDEERSGGEPGRGGKDTYLRQKKTAAQRATASNATHPSKGMGRCEDWRIFEAHFNSVYILCMCSRYERKWCKREESKELD